jgi:hypothetical protein
VACLKAKLLWLQGRAAGSVTLVYSSSFLFLFLYRWRACCLACFSKPKDSISISNQSNAADTFPNLCPPLCMSTSQCSRKTVI